MRRILTVLLLALLAVLAVASPAAARRTHPPHPPHGGSPPPVVLDTDALILAAHNKACTVVADYTNCGTLRVVIADYGDTGWDGAAHPADGWVEYNKFYVHDDWGWQRVAAHEVGGHVDTWNELVARVGVSQSWTDYYQLDTLAQAWWAAKGWTLTTTYAKNMLMDCAGLVAHGYGAGNYMLAAHVPVEACDGWHSVVDAAVAG